MQSKHSPILLPERPVLSMIAQYSVYDTVEEDMQLQEEGHFSCSLTFCTVRKMTVWCTTPTVFRTCTNPDGSPKACSLRYTAIPGTRLMDLPECTDMSNAMGHDRSPLASTSCLPLLSHCNNKRFFDHMCLGLNQHMLTHGQGAEGGIHNMQATKLKVILGIQ